MVQQRYVYYGHRERAKQVGGQGWEGVRDGRAGRMPVLACWPQRAGAPTCFHPAGAQMELKACNELMERFGSRTAKVH